MDKFGILITEPQGYAEEAILIYQKTGPVFLGYDSAVDSTTKKIIRALVVKFRYQLDDVFLAGFPFLKYIVSPTTGLNHIDLDYCSSRHIKVLSLKHEVSFLKSLSSTAELTFGLIIALTRNIIGAHNDVAVNHRWNRETFKGRELSFLRLGVLGFGRLGQKVASYGRAFGMNVTACDPFIEKDYMESKGVTACSQEKLFLNSDIVSIHIPFNRANKLLVSRPYIMAMPKASFLVNTSRGEILDEKAVLECLESGHLAGASLDVISDEHRIHDWKQHPLIQYARVHQNLILTPHIGGCTQEAMERAEVFMARKLSFEILA